MKNVGDVEIERGAELLKADEVGVEPAAADLVAARLGDVAHAEAGQHRTEQHHRPPEAAGPAAVVVRAQVVRVDVGGSERIALFGQALHFDAHAPQQLDELYDVQNPRDIVYDYLFLSEQRGAEYLKRFVFGALGRDFTAAVGGRLRL